MTDPTCAIQPCQRAPRWTICGMTADREIVVTLASCDNAIHQALCRLEAWKANRVALVSTARLVKQEEAAP